MKKTTFVRALLALAWLSALSCGPAEVRGRVDMELRLAVFSSSDVLYVYALSQDLKGGGKLSCAQLDNNSSLESSMTDPKLDILSQTSARANDLERGEVTLSLDEIPAGSDRVFAAEVIDPSVNMRIGFGCTPNITISGGQKTRVELSVHEL